MDKQERNRTLIILLIATLFTVFAVRFNNQTPKVEYDNRVPPAPQEQRGDGYYIWDSVTKQWKFVTYIPDRANAKKKPGMDEDQLQRFLEKKVPGYLEDTYWGQEYDLDDPDDDESYEDGE